MPAEPPHWQEESATSGPQAGGSSGTHPVSIAKSPSPFPPSRYFRVNRTCEPQAQPSERGHPIREDGPWSSRPGSTRLNGGRRGTVQAVTRLGGCARGPKRSPRLGAGDWAAGPEGEPARFPLHLGFCRRTRQPRLTGHSRTWRYISPLDARYKNFEPKRKCYLFSLAFWPIIRRAAHNGLGCSANP